MTMTIAEKFSHLDIPVECPEDPASCDCAWHENLRHAEESHHAGDQLCIDGIPPPPPPPEAYLVAQLKEAHTILSRLSVSFDCKLPQNVYLAMSYLHIEIATRTPVPRVTDDDLECWGNYYLANRLYERGILFATFMQDPRAIAEAITFRWAMPIPDGEEFYPLLPEQREAAERIESHNRPRRRAMSAPVLPDDLAFLKRQAD